MVGAAQASQQAISRRDREQNNSRKRTSTRSLRATSVDASFAARCVSASALMRSLAGGALGGGRAAQRVASRHPQRSCAAQRRLIGELSNSGSTVRRRVDERAGLTRPGSRSPRQRAHFPGVGTHGARSHRTWDRGGAGGRDGGRAAASSCRSIRSRVGARRSAAFPARGGLGDDGRERGAVLSHRRSPATRRLQAQRARRERAGGRRDGSGRLLCLCDIHQARRDRRSGEHC